MLKLLKYLRKQEYVCLIISVIFIVTQVWLDLKMPDYMSEITQLTESPGSELSEIITAGLKMLACALGSLFSSVIVAIAASKLASGFTAVLREKQFEKVENFSMEEINKFSAASLITRATNDVNQLQMFIVMGLQSIIKAPIMAVWAVIKISGKNTEWTLTTGAFVLVLLIIVSICMSLAIPVFRKIQIYNDRVNRITRENITGLAVVHAYNAEDYQINKFEKANETLTNAHLFTGRVMSFLIPAIQAIMNGLTLVIYWTGAYQINNAFGQKRLTLFSDMVVFSSYAVQVVIAFMMLVMIFMIWPRAQVSAKRINEVLDTEPSIKDGTEVDGLAKQKGEISFKNVSFAYPGASDDVLKNINFDIHKGETLAIIGSTGCGKSTLINLIPRFYDTSEGEVLVDGRNVKEYSQYALRNKIGYVSQKAFLFSGDIKNNIAFGDNGSESFSDQNVADSIYIAGASEFVDKLPDGMNAYVSQDGSNFSGGQKQRLSIARAVCRHPEILIFDDSFSALDYKTDRKLRSVLHRECEGVTKIIVAQRIGTIKDADKIICLDYGRIAGMGTHEELLKSCEVYRQIALSQLSKEELENAGTKKL